MRRVGLVGFFVAGLLFLSNSAFADTCPAQPTVIGAAAAFQNAAQSGSARAFSNAAGRYTDVRGLSMFALGQYRSGLPASQEGKYVYLTKVFMGKFMANNANQIPTSNVTILSCYGNTVTARLGVSTNVTFRMSGNSRIADVSIMGISVAGAMRSKFTGILRDNNGDFNALYSFLQQ